MKILVFGYGNPGRKDDGLGNEFTEALKKINFSDNEIEIEYDSNYQLNIEDAERIKNMDVVIFADASEENIEDFCFSVVDGTGEPAFTTHSANPEYIFRLCKELFNSEPVTMLLHIKGYEWQFEEGITPKAGKNLNKAIDFVSDCLFKSSNSNELIEKLLNKKCIDV